MRAILTLALLSFNFIANAKVEEPLVGEVRVPVIEMAGPATLDKNQLSAANEVKIAILYRMKENIIRRELSFIPKKKWMKWT